MLFLADFGDGQQLALVLFVHEVQEILSRGQPFRELLELVGAEIQHIGEGELAPFVCIFGCAAQTVSLDL